MNEERYRDAIPGLLSHIEAICISRRIWFDENHLFILYTPLLLERGQEFADLLSVLGDTATCYLRIHKLDRAFEFATKGISIGRFLMEGRNGTYRKEEVDAGDVDCRLIRASVLIHCEDYERAREEIDKARILAGRPLMLHQSAS